MDELEGIIRERIRREGPITFEAFMNEALYHPGLGYYASPDTEIGRAGDFYTSPHLHAAFGAMLGKQVEEMWRVMGKPGDFTVVEAGAGRGWLARDMLDALRDKEIFASLSYVLVEPSPHMARRQGDLLSEYGEKLRWAGAFRELGPVRGCVVTNELVDALPVHLVEMTEEGLREVYVTADEKGFGETLGPPSDEAVGRYIEEFSEGLPTGYRTEANLAARDWLGEVAGALEAGFVLTVDYGYPAWEYYSPERPRGTLLCYRGHQAGENPYENVGGQDITAHVNFTALRKWGEELGLRPVGFARQGVFLVSLGIDEYIRGLGPRDFEFEVARIKGLIMPGTMGESHKVLVQYKGGGEPPGLRGFAMKNQLKSLS